MIGKLLLLALVLGFGYYVFFLPPQKTAAGTGGNPGPAR